MNHVQWMFMAEAFRQKEEKEQKRQMELVSDVYTSATKALKDTFIHLLGLDIGAGKAQPGKPTPYLPLLVTLGKPEVVEELLKRESDDKSATEVLDNSGIDDLNDGLMNLDMGDLEPIFAGENSDDPMERWFADQNVETMAAMGVELHDGSLDLVDDEETKFIFDLGEKK